jgi:hypothetical protein
LASTRGIPQFAPCHVTIYKICAAIFPESNFWPAQQPFMPSCQGRSASDTGRLAGKFTSDVLVFSTAELNLQESLKLDLREQQQKAAQ